MAAMMAALAMMMQLVFSQETSTESRCGPGSCDDASMLQVATTRDEEPCNWQLAAKGGSCVGVCRPLNLKCDRFAQMALQGAALNGVVDDLGEECDNFPDPGIDDTFWDQAPYISVAGGGSTCFSSGPNSDSQCFRRGGELRRICCCVPRGQVVGDPHIYTLKGAHYTLLQSGNFLAWSFFKAPVEWHLFAAYAGARARFTTQSLLLQETHTGRTLEMTAEDCAWKMKTKEGWHKVQPHLMPGAASLDIQEVHRPTSDSLKLESVIILMEKKKKLAKLLTHCGRNKHLNFKVTMYDPKDLDHVGGELGAGDTNQGHLIFLSAKLSSVVQADSEFQVSGSWTSLGGSEGATKYLQSKQQNGTALLTTCSEAEEQEAEKTCAKYLEKDGDHPEMFSDCVYDICHGGGEADALSAAAFISA